MEAAHVSTGRNAQARGIRQPSSSSTYLVGVVGFSLGIIIAFPPFLADSTWRSAMKSGNVEQVIAAAEKWPRNSYRMTNIVVTLAENKFNAQALELARKSVEFNPDHFDSWKLLAGIEGSTVEEKARAITEMKRLDPRNTNLQ